MESVLKAAFVAMITWVSVFLLLTAFYQRMNLINEGSLFVTLCLATGGAAAAGFYACSGGRGGSRHRRMM